MLDTRVQEFRVGHRGGGAGRPRSGGARHCKRRSVVGVPHRAAYGDGDSVVANTDVTVVSLVGLATGCFRRRRASVGLPWEVTSKGSLPRPAKLRQPCQARPATHATRRVFRAVAAARPQRVSRPPRLPWGHHYGAGARPYPRPDGQAGGAVCHPPSVPEGRTTPAAEPPRNSAGAPSCDTTTRTAHRSPPPTGSGDRARAGRTPANAGPARTGQARPHAAAGAQEGPRATPRRRTAPPARPSPTAPHRDRPAPEPRAQRRRRRTWYRHPAR